VGKNLIDFPGDVSTKGADLVTHIHIILMNDIISDPKGKATCIDIKHFYLGNQLPNKEYIIRFHRSIITGPQILAAVQAAR
jgi:hypothetical protein